VPANISFVFINIPGLPSSFPQSPFVFNNIRALFCQEMHSFARLVGLSQSAGRIERVMLGRGGVQAFLPSPQSQAPVFRSPSAVFTIHKSEFSTAPESNFFQNPTHYPSLSSAACQETECPVGGVIWDALPFGTPVIRA
jgi:hypothetical protein